jgi:hypothetical protein
MSSPDPLEAIMDITANAIKDMSENFTRRLSELQTTLFNSITQHIEFTGAHIVNQNKQILKLQEKCANLEAIQMNLIASISVTSPAIYATIRENAEIGAKQLSEQNLSGCDLAKSLRKIAGMKENKKAHLWLVPPRSYSDSEGKPTQ